jgi:hypothetical protein
LPDIKIIKLLITLAFTNYSHLLYHHIDYCPFMQQGVVSAAVTQGKIHELVKRVYLTTILELRK